MKGLKHRIMRFTMFYPPVRNVRLPSIHIDIKFTSKNTTHLPDKKEIIEMTFDLLIMAVGTICHWTGSSLILTDIGLAKW